MIKKTIQGKEYYVSNGERLSFTKTELKRARNRFIKQLELKRSLN